MLKAAIEKIQEMCYKPQRFDIDGHHYFTDRDGLVNEIKPDLEMRESINLTSLDALIKIVKTEAVKDYSLLYVTVSTHNAVKCFTNPSENLRWNREYLYTASATDVPGWNDKVTMNFEEALIALRTRFQPATDTEYALRLLSNITTGGKVTYNDNGVATSIITKKGIDLQSNESIKPIIRLRPYRTFQEVEQPESEFLIRISERGITFIEADGGMWKLHARSIVKAFLEAELEEEVESGKVVITL